MAVDKSPARIQEMFDRISPTYDLLNHLLSMNMDARWRRVAADECPVRGRVLDICCGTGDLALAVARRRSADVVGLDFAARMIRLAGAKSRGERIRYVQGDALALPFAAESFDAVTVAFGVRNMKDPRRGMSEMARVLRSGGRAIVLEFAVPQTPGVRQLYALYMSRILTTVGDAVSRSHAYRYLSSSVELWHDPRTFLAMMAECGFPGSRHRPLSLGIAHLFVGTRA